MARPNNCGILAVEAYFPQRFVAQIDLEAADGCAGKYTSGLGQEKLAFVDDREDIGSVKYRVSMRTEKR
jgi:hydroxymethylglutaryl-CoA synthase